MIFPDEFILGLLLVLFPPAEVTTGVWLLLMVSDPEFGLGLTILILEGAKGLGLKLGLLLLSESSDNLGRSSWVEDEEDRDSLGTES